MKKGLRRDFGPRQSLIFMSRRRLQGTRSFLRFGISKRKNGVRQRSRPYRERDGDDEDALSDSLAAVNDRLDDLTRQIERMTLGNAEIRPSGNERNGGRVADALARLDRRLEQVIEEGRAAAPPRRAPAAVAEAAPPQAYSPPPPPPAAYTPGPAYTPPPAYAPPPPQTYRRHRRPMPRHHSLRPRQAPARPTGRRRLSRGSASSMAALRP